VVAVTERDVEFLRHGPHPLLARLYQPGGPGGGPPGPGVVAVHGGAWTSGDRLDNADTARNLVEAGFTVLSVDFRMPPEAAYPDPVADVSAGIRWFKASAAGLGVDPSRIGGIGYSSGGHQLMLAAMRPGDPRYAALAVPGAAEADSTLAFAILLYAVLDPLERYRMTLRTGRIDLTARHQQYWPVTDDMAEGNPTLLLDRGEPADLPPALVIQGWEDANLTPDMGERFTAAYRRAGGHAELAMYDDAPHGFIKNESGGPAARAATERLLAFARQFAAGPCRQPAAGDDTTRRSDR
jgi:acetyl esterase